MPSLPLYGPPLADDGFDAILNPGPQPSWMDSLNALSQAVGSHPLYKPIDSASDTDVESENDEAIRSVERRRAPKGKGKGKEVVKEVRKEVVKPSDQSPRKRTRRNEPILPPRPSSPDAVQRPSKRATRSSTRSANDSNLHSDMMNVDEPAGLPVASSSRLPPQPSETPAVQAMDLDYPATVPTSPKASPTIVKAEPSPSPAKKTSARPVLPPSSSPVVELSSDDGAARPTRKPSNQRASNVRAASSKAHLVLQQQRSRLSAASAKLTRATATGRRKSARKSFGEAIASVQKLSAPKLADEFKTISDFNEHLSQFEPLKPGSYPLSGTRVVVVNTDHWRRASHAVLPAGGSTRSTRNRFDAGVRTVMTVLAKNGATLVKPEEFVPPPYDVAGEPFDDAQAEKEQWTTHIIPVIPKHQREPKYDEILKCLGHDEGGIRWDELGPFVKVVKFEWVSESAKAKGKAAEWPFLVKGEYRDAEKETDVSAEEKKREIEERLDKRERERRRAERKKAEESKRQGARGRTEQDDTEEEDPDEAYEVLDRVSPFTSQDFPIGETAAPGYFDQQNSATTSTGGSSLPRRKRRPYTTDEDAPTTDEPPSAADTTDTDPIVDPDLTTRALPSPPSPKKQQKPLAMEGLEDEFALIRKYGTEHVDKYFLDDEPSESAGG
ncbi:hypothetical protein JCM8547_003761 [Rhodosporidiobolus lusitaniae]